jgi:tetratricopeptide (TPR) repeat protein
LVEGTTFGLVGALAAFPRRLAAREVARQGGRLGRGVTRGTSHVVFGRTLLARAGDATIEARRDAARSSGRRLLSENGFLRALGLLGAPGASTMSRATLIDQSQLPPDAVDLLSLFDAFENDAEPYSFRDLILARKYAGLLASGASWAAIARSVHRSGAVASLTARSLRVEHGAAVCARDGEGVSELDGQLRFDLGPSDDSELDETFACAEAVEAAGRHADAAALYGRCLAIDPGDAVAAFNRANCLRAAGRPDEAAHDYARAIKLDPGFVEAWFNFGGLMSEQGRIPAARRHLRQAVALDARYADAVFNLASLEFDAGNLAEARRWWERYIELDPDSAWARTAERGIRFVAERSARESAG